MYRIILIDDEPQIRHGLSNLIIWDELGIELSGEASNGQEALELIKKTDPQIAIADIQMPIMDGITLLKKAKEFSVNTKFIMLSGFNQFDYVRESLKLGACNYLLKPVNEDELINTLQETIAQIDNETARKQQFDESMTALLNNTLNRLLTHRIDVRELREKCELLGITLRCNNMAVGILRPVFNNSDVSQRNIMFDSLNICKAFFKNRVDAYCVVDPLDNIAVIFKDPANDFTDNSIIDMLSECAELIHSEIGTECICALGTDAASFKELPASYQNAKHKTEVIMLLGKTDSSDTMYKEACAGVSDNFNSEEARRQLSAGNLNAFSSYVQDYYLYIIEHNQNTDLLSIKFHTIELVSQILDIASRCYISASDLTKLKETVFVDIKESDSLKTLKCSFNAFTDSLCKLSNNTSSSTYSHNVSMAVNYIIKNYNDANLSLKTLANQLGVNSAYLGRQFSLETGMFFSDYLNNHRIREAKKLLSDTSMKVSEVSESVGFSSVSYFNTIYKKITGGVDPGKSLDKAITFNNDNNV